MVQGWGQSSTTVRSVFEPWLGLGDRGEISAAMTSGNAWPLAGGLLRDRPPAPPVAAITERVRGPAWLQRRGRRPGSWLRRAAGRDACAWCPPSRERHEP